MTSELQDKPLPPGNRAFPLLGETLAFLKDAFAFVERRVARHGPVFRTHLLGRTTAVIRLSMYVGMLFGAVAAVTMVQALGWQATVLIVSAVCFVLLVSSSVYGPGDRPAEQLAPIDWPPL